MLRNKITPGYELYIATYSPDYIIQQANALTCIDVKNEDIVSFDAAANCLSIDLESIKNIAANAKTQSTSNFSQNEIEQLYVNVLFLKEAIASAYPGSRHMRQEFVTVAESLLFSLGYCLTLGTSKNDETQTLLKYLADHLDKGNKGFIFWTGLDSHGIQLRFLELLFCYNGNMNHLKHIHSLRDVAIILLHPLVEQLHIENCDDLWIKLEHKIAPTMPMGLIARIEALANN